MINANGAISIPRESVHWSLEKSRQACWGMWVEMYKGTKTISFWVEKQDWGTSHWNINRREVARRENYIR